MVRSRVLELRAHAKLNLALAVAPPEPAGSDRPGWHRIASWMHAIELHDTVRIDPRGGAHHVRWEDGADVDWPLVSDLGVRALALCEQDTSLEIVKRVPAGGGLGGGSSDAGAVIRALAPDLPVDAIASLGSDVPFFVDGDRSPPRPALVMGFGETIERGEPLDAGVVLLLPGLHAPTPAVYRAFDRDPGTLAGFEDKASEVAHLAASPALGIGAISEALINDLAEAATRAVPQLAEAIKIAQQAADAVGLGRVHMTGSGASLFMLTEPGAQEAAAENIRRHLPPRSAVGVVATRLV